MKRFKPPGVLAQTIFAAMIGSLVAGGWTAILRADEPNSDAAPAKTVSTSTSTNSVSTNAMPPDAEAPRATAKRRLTGAELYSIHCNRCHQERYPTERTGAQWKTIMLHMQARANLPVSQSKLILQYLQENSGR